ncbi:Hpt domain-containing protein [Pseudonocardia sp. TMWB2A]|uniref:Hpt domain-containing protein n=1 Tax=Pseudonocardia sp. TMWB2A TaxID=687430 RepID=UPI00307E6B10
MANYIPMSFHSSQLGATVAAAIGQGAILTADPADGDVALAEDLRRAFLESAARHADFMRRARCDANWQISAWRLKGLSATFGITGLVRLAEEAASGVPGDPAILRRIQNEIAAL